MGAVYAIDDHRRSHASREHLLELADELIEIGRTLRVEMPALQQRARSDSQPGFRSSTRFDGGGARRMTGDGHSDPLGEIVAERVTAESQGSDLDPVRTVYRKALRALLEAVRAARIAESHAVRMRPPHQLEVAGCTNHAAHALFAVTRRTNGDLCRWCEDQRHPTRLGRLPNRDELVAHEDVRHARTMRKAA